MGEPAPAVLAAAVPVRHCLDGREPDSVPPGAAYDVVLLMAAIVRAAAAEAHRTGRAGPTLKRTSGWPDASKDP